MERIPQFEPLIKETYAEEVSNQVLSGWIGSAKATLEFEGHIQRITGSKYCLSTTSGTTALLIALAALELPPKSTVLFPAYTFLAGANAVRFLGHTIKLIDVREDTTCMDPDQVDGRTPVLFVNQNGYVGKDVAEVLNKCRIHNQFLIEDSSQALGIPGAGRTGDIGVFSFSVPKIVTTGQGGALITDNQSLYERCRRIRDHGEDWRKDRIHNHLGVNFKFNDVLAALGNSQLRDLNAILANRKRVFDLYRQHIPLLDFGYSSTWMVIYRSRKPDELIEALTKTGIQAVRYYRPINHNPPYQDGHCYAIAEKVYLSDVYLPSSLTLSQLQIEKICSLVKRADNP